MVEALVANLTSIGMLGIVLAIIAVANIILGTTYNVSVCDKPFDGKKMLKGILKAVVIYIGVVLLVIGATILPIALQEAGLGDLVKPEVLDTFSVTAIATLMISVVITQAVDAFGNLKKLWGRDTAQQAIEANYDVEKENI